MNSASRGTRFRCPDDRSSSTQTLLPDDNRRLARLLPIAPAPPVIRYLAISDRSELPGVDRRDAERRVGRQPLEAAWPHPLAYRVVDRRQEEWSARDMRGIDVVIEHCG